MTTPPPPPPPTPRACVLVGYTLRGRKHLRSLTRGVVGAGDQHHSTVWGAVLICSASCALAPPPKKNGIPPVKLTMLTQGHSLMHLSMIKADTYLDTQAQ